MTTDNRTNEPTEAQVEAAYRAFCEARLGRAMTDEEHEAMRSRLELTWIGPAIAAAAQGAAPQAESAPKSSYISPSLPSMIRNLWKSDPSENSVRTALKLAGDLIQELIDLRAAPVLPSSTVGEAALIRKAKAEAWDACIGEMPIDPDWKNFYGDNNPYRKGARHD